MQANQIGYNDFIDFKYWHIENKKLKNEFGKTRLSSTFRINQVYVRTKNILQLDNWTLLNIVFWEYFRTEQALQGWWNDSENVLEEGSMTK